MALTLYGDPEMRVWRQPASRVWPIVKAPIKGIDVIEVELPKPPIPDPPPYVVHLAQPDGLQRTLRAQAGSIVRLDTSEAESGDLFLTVSIDGDVDHVPYQQTLTVDRAGWLVGRVLAVSHHEHGRPWTSVTVANGDPATGRRTVLVMDERPDRDVIVEAVVAAQLAGSEINLYVDGSGDDARVERFRLEDVR